MATAHLKKFLLSLPKEELVKHIIELDKKFKPVQDYYQVWLTNDLTGVIDKFKKQIENEFFPTRGLPKMRLSVARKAITEAKKIGLPPTEMADLMLFYVEMGAQFTNEYGDINEPFYNSMENMFRRTLQFMDSEGLLIDYKLRTNEIIRKVENTGWGFYDTMSDFYYEFYKE